MRLTWSREPREKGLAAVCQGERGWHLKADGKMIGTVRPHYKGFSREKIGYYWYARSDELGIPVRNTAGIKHYATPEEAKEACKKYVLDCIGSAARAS